MIKSKLSSGFAGAKSFDWASRPEYEAFRALCISVDTPVALGAWLRLKYGEVKQLLDMELRPGDYLQDPNGCSRFADDYLVVSYLSKYDSFGTISPEDREKEALRRFAAAEDQCRLTNSRLRKHDVSSETQAILLIAQRKIAELLGPEPVVDNGAGMWGKGSTVTLKGERATLADKLREQRISVSRPCLPYLLSAMESDPHWFEVRTGHAPVGRFSYLRWNSNEFKIVDYCTVTTVPKNSKTDRTIAIEPTGNIFVQKAIGSHLRSALKRVGVDLDDQSRNQRAAREGSLTNDLATIDLSMASDTVSYELVAQLLPFEWFCLLDRCRSRVYKLDGKLARFEKFSTMGNGFTFELESLIFWALSRACLLQAGVRGRVCVYGDDIIVPSGVSQLLLKTLDEVGFRANPSKTFVQGPFRESCGKHYFLGNDVTPVYQKVRPDSLVEAVRAHNRLVRYAHRRGRVDTILHNPGKLVVSSGYHGWLDARFRKAVLVYRQCGLKTASVHKKKRPVVPVLPLGHLGDSGFLLTRDELADWEFVPNLERGWRTWQFVFVPRRKSGQHYTDAKLPFYLRFTYRRASHDRFEIPMEIEISTVRDAGSYVLRRKTSIGVDAAAWT